MTPFRSKFPYERFQFDRFGFRGMCTVHYRMDFKMEISSCLIIQADLFDNDKSFTSNQLRFMPSQRFSYGLI